MEEIKWTVDHDCGINSYFLIGDYKETRFLREVYKGFWGLPLMYAKWNITRHFKILYGKV